MVDAIHFTNFNRSCYELEEVALFSILVAGKNALTTSSMLDKFLQDYSHLAPTPFGVFRSFSSDILPKVLKSYGFGCYKNKAIGIHQLVRAGYDLKTCSIEDLEKIYMIGLKTSRMFVLHTRANVECIPLDVHILHYLKDLGFDVPKSTPSSKKNKNKYLEIERLAISLAKASGLSCADWDLSTWRKYSGRVA